MKKLLLSITCLFLSLMIFATLPNTSSSNIEKTISKYTKEPARDYYLIQIYHCSTAKQIENIDLYLKKTFLPYLHQNGIEKVGVFAPLENDTASDKRLYVWVPFKNIQKLEELDQKIEALDPMGSAAIIHLENADGSLPYTRIEKIISKAFKFQPQYETKLTLTKSSSRIYEYRSYESPTENLHLRKVHMFNEGGEVTLFAQLNFNAIFYSKVIAGSNMPNLIYMTSFNSMEDRNAHWDRFDEAPLWKKISAAPEYLNSVNRNETVLMSARDYADF
ncbi:MAG: NIPSNAP family protein [Sediminibacterium sp.]|nr:NIPSNAP family protein [Sediminibacterium sp.]